MSQPNVENQAAVLVVDDNPLIVNVLRSLLVSEKYHVYVSNNGAEAMDVLNSKGIDLIICDVMMPRMDGYQLHESVRKKPELSHIPFIFLTALSDSGEVSKGREAGADDYIVKPFDPRELLSIVRGKVIRSKNLKYAGEEKYDSFRRRIIHTLSHEFRTPLVAINTGTELLLEQKQSIDESKMHHLLEAIRRGGQRLERLVTDFMLLQQIEAGIAQRLYDTRAENKAIAALVWEILESHSEVIQQEGFEVKVTDRSEGRKCKVYEPHIRDIVWRLISNSMKFREKETLIEIVLYLQSEDMILEVRDRGVGIDPQQIKEAIDIFGQLNRDKLEQQGGGLGLAIATRYASINKGRLEFDKRPGGGSIVSLALPLSMK
ncbi:MAG: response regulator [Deltaproteobacteria bacterium]|nr:response regulator [Deltaproteobacteria bacterium]